MLKLSEISNFSTPAFFTFLVLAFLIFWMTPKAYKQWTLLGLSYFFYSSYHLSHVFILIVTTLIDFSFGKIIYERKQAKKPIHLFVASCLSVNLGMLLFFKYTPFVLPTLLNLTLQSIMIPLGLSFFTLQSIGYILDISRGRLIPEKNLVTYALFVSFFPQIIAGPIEKAKDIIPQYSKNFDLKSIKWSMAFYLFSYGFFKKYIVADNIASILGPLEISEHSSLLLKYLSLIFFFIRIYCDFSGYTNMARGIALIFSIDLKENFNFPLFANSPQDFWERWHMSLGTWIKNYFYTPLLLFFANPYFAILVVFPVMGLWHGANSNFILWGLSWACLIILFKTLNLKKLSKINSLNIFLMFNISSLLMIFYKVKNFTELKQYFVFNAIHPVPVQEVLEQLTYTLPLLAAFIVIYEYILFKKNDHYFLLKTPFIVQLFFYLLLFFGYRFYSGVATEQIFYLQF